ncbi:MAG: phosphoadenosine phosphosulfate reductase family protein [Lachnospiraceae bacterium]|nr:phosphoadenosine phosphosulfate reductase family protein [Lachnospiraceae bacterium]
MLKYKCKLHNIWLKESTCPECGSREHVEVQNDIFWCAHCNVPTYEKVCPICGETGKRVATDLRPVFPEKRLLLEIILGTPFSYVDSSVWSTSGNYYLIDGKLIRFSIKNLETLDIEEIQRQLRGLESKNSRAGFEKYKNKFIECNQSRLNAIDEEALRYIREVTDGVDGKNMFVSFSGGKDSAVTSDLVMRALGNPRILHIFGDTTLEFPETEKYVEQFKKEHPGTPLLSSRNKEKKFEELCELIGPPSRVMRWCWCCPNNSAWSEFLSKIYMPEQYAHWHNLLVSFAEKIGKPDAEEYIATGKWKARQGGNKVEYSKKSVISFTPCAVEEQAFNYDLQRPVSEELYQLFQPFGYLDFNMGNSRLGEVYVVRADGKLMLKLQGRIGSSHLKVTILNHQLDGAKTVSAAEEKIKCQLTKYQMCMECRACEGICKYGAIKIELKDNNQISYHIDSDKCIRCGHCVNHFVSGCYMRKVLATKY